MSVTTNQSIGEAAAHPIQVVCRRTGLSAYVLRAWERRYAAVSPQRSASGRRLYSDTDIERLQWLQRATRAGRRIGDIARLPRAELAALCGADERGLAQSESPSEAAPASASASYQACLRSVRDMAADALEGNLYRASMALSTSVLLEEVLAPLMAEIGEAYRGGRLGIGQEHMASASIRSFLGSLRVHTNTQPGAPRIVVTTPSGQVHEIGACMAAITAAMEGWNAVYLGPDTPAAEIAAAARHVGASAVALSLVYPRDDPDLPHELRRLRRALPEQVALIVGGRARSAYRAVLEEIGADSLDTLPAMRAHLSRLRVAAKRHEDDGAHGLPPRRSQ